MSISAQQIIKIQNNRNSNYLFENIVTIRYGLYLNINFSPINISHDELVSDDIYYCDYSVFNPIHCGFSYRLHNVFRNIGSSETNMLHMHTIWSNSSKFESKIISLMKNNFGIKIIQY